MSATIVNNNNNISTTVFLVCRDPSQLLPIGFTAIKTEVVNNQSTIGNYTIQPGGKVTVKAGQHIAIAGQTTLIIQDRTIVDQEQINCWQ
jgi:hypothetical protein